MNLSCLLNDVHTGPVFNQQLTKLRAECYISFITTCPFMQVKYKFNEKHLPE